MSLVKPPKTTQPGHVSGARNDTTRVPVEGVEGAAAHGGGRDDVGSSGHARSDSGGGDDGTDVTTGRSGLFTASQV